MNGVIVNHNFIKFMTLFPTVLIEFLNSNVLGKWKGGLGKTKRFRQNVFTFIKLYHISQ